ncbi:glycosyltransferase family 2 protein [Lacinutrix jangbogonensis]|uniref:glycosyltransferase family 2 protein n=1 Tax=Lacinutrix jangbogonensis TaxID=1469557 RepID=UPI00053E6C9D|nr:glycosyltransferase family 2 protein [Lacinutrix jangbogonensis]
MISVVIRNKNEAKALAHVLSILTSLYSNDIGEIILVDNKSTDNSVLVAEKYGCKIVTISHFTYGKATNLGINEAKFKYVLLLSAHAIPIGSSFFKSAIASFENNSKVAGIRFVNSFENYIRAHKNDYQVKNPLKYGLMTACAMVNKSVWEEYKFDEALVASEDKYWSKTVVDHGFLIKDVAETFFYFARRTEVSNLNRFKHETIADYQLHGEKYSSYFKIVASSVYKMTIINMSSFFQNIYNELKFLKIKFQIKDTLNKTSKR